MWGIPAFLFLIAFGHRVAPGVIAKELMQAFSASGTLVGLLSAAYFYPYAGLMVPAGVLIDALGVRRVVAAGGAVMGLGTILMGVTTAQGLLFAGRLAVGAGASVTFVGALKVAAVWFPPSHFATLSAVTATMGVLGGLAATAPLAALVAVAGWRWALVSIGLITVAGAVLCLAAVRDHPGGRLQSAPPAAALRDVLAGTRQVLQNRRTWPPFIAFFLLYSAASNLMLWVVPYLRDVYGLETTEAAVQATGISLALMVAGPLTGYLSDRVFHRRKLPYTVLTACQAALYLLLVLTAGRLPLAGVYGLFLAMGAVGGAFVLTWPLGREVNPPHLSGVAVAVVNMGGFLGAALTQGPVGAVLDARWAGTVAAGARVYPPDAYQAAFSVCGLFALGSMVATFFLSETRGRHLPAPAGRGEILP
jgi:MFS family permease